MNRTEYFSLAIFAGLIGLFITDKASAESRSHLAPLYEQRLEELGKIAFPPLIEGSVQFFVPNQDPLYNSNTRDQDGKSCKRQVGYDEGRWVIFEFCEGEE